VLPRCLLNLVISLCNIFFFINSSNNDNIKSLLLVLLFINSLDYFQLLHLILDVPEDIAYNFIHGVR